MKKSVAEIFYNMMGLDDDEVKRTGRINGKGYGFRLRWKEILDGKRTPDPAYTGVVKLSLAYGVGLPGKMQDTTQKRDSLVFVTTTGLFPWDERMDNLKETTDRMIAEKAAEERLPLEAAKKPEIIDVKADAGDTEVPETLEIVEPPPREFNPGGRR